LPPRWRPHGRRHGARTGADTAPIGAHDDRPAPHGRCFDRRCARFVPADPRRSPSAGRSDAQMPDV